MNADKQVVYLVTHALVDAALAFSYCPLDNDHMPYGVGWFLDFETGHRIVMWIMSDSGNDVVLALDPSYQSGLAKAVDIVPMADLGMLRDRIYGLLATAETPQSTEQHEV